MALLDTLVGWFNDGKSSFQYVPIPPGRAPGSGDTGEPLQAGAAYFRLWLNEMRLGNGLAWFATWYPAVHSLIRLQYGGKSEDIPHIAGALKLPNVTATNLHVVIQLNYPMTTLMPFNGGVVELEAGLLAMQSTNYVERFLKVMGDFSGLLAVPQLSTAIKLAGPIADGVQELLGVSNGALHLGVHQAFVGGNGPGANQLRGGYMAVIRSPGPAIPEHELWVVNGQLRRGVSASVAATLPGVTYMLFRIEHLVERDDWESLTSIKEPRDKALEALDRGGAETAESYLRSAVIAAQLSPDLTRADRARVKKALIDEFNEARQVGLGAVAGERPSLGDLIRRQMSPTEALAAGDPSLEELFAGR